MRLSTTTPPAASPLPFGRISSSDTVELADGKRRMYSAVPYAFTGPDYEQLTLTPPGDPQYELTVNNVGNYIAVTPEVFAGAPQ